MLSLVVSLFTSTCLYCLPFMSECKKCDSKLEPPACPTNGRSGNFKQFNCPDGYYNDLATLLLTTNDDVVRNIFSTNTPMEYHPASLVTFFLLYSVLGLVTFGIVVPSGLFLPIILMGSAYGRMIGLAMGSLTNIDQGLYAVLGAASLMAGSMRMTVSVCLIFLELANNLKLLPGTMIVLLISMTGGDCFNPSIYEIILHLKGLPFLDAKPETWMSNLTVGELADAKAPVVTLSGVEKAGRIVDVLKTTTHNCFPVLDREGELHGLILRANLIKVLMKKWFLEENWKTTNQEVKERFSWIDLAEKEDRIEQVNVKRDEMEMYVDLHPFTNTAPYTVMESMSVAKAMVLFRRVGLRHMLVLPKHRTSGVSSILDPNACFSTDI
ncbi:hypothetical protein MLD38_013096 [Melastoma candidum]|uniref:Uncharacterized protein n=1 Tax=Melastoma candidum TaxID=119954 RepID=A0ACB9R7W5_9MYRT|nr:hypothetical protein MLD38_013096 [Melastoma candidum]